MEEREEGKGVVVCVVCLSTMQQHNDIHTCRVVQPADVQLQIGLGCGSLFGRLTSLQTMKQSKNKTSLRGVRRSQLVPKPLPLYAPLHGPSVDGQLPAHPLERVLCHRRVADYGKKGVAAG